MTENNATINAAVSHWPLLEWKKINHPSGATGYQASVYMSQSRSYRMEIRTAPSGPANERTTVSIASVEKGIPASPFADAAATTPDNACQLFKLRLQQFNSLCGAQV
jgi:hypothetical protein